MESTDNLFDQLKQTNDKGNIYWSARNLSKALEYSDYRNFEKVIAKAKEDCVRRGYNADDHFVDSTEMVTIGSGAQRKLRNIELSYKACYFIVRNADQTKASVENSLSYFIENQINRIEDSSEKHLRKLSLQDELSEFLMYTTPQGDVKVEAILSEETIWLTQEQMSRLFGVQTPAISKHLKGIFETMELEEEAVVSILETTAQDHKKYKVKYYNLDAIISVGYRVNSARATQFRIWATQILKEFIIRGFVMDDYRLKNGRYFGKDYFQELLERVRSIRASERRIYQKITDIFAECSLDYDTNSKTAHDFYAEVQNKFHYAITGQTAPEIIYKCADAEKEFMGLRTWKNAPEGRVLKSDVTVAKNYLRQDEIQRLERAISGYFDYIERLIEKRTSFTMMEFALSVSKFLEFNEYEILTGKGNISRRQAENKAIGEYQIFNKRQNIESDFDRIIKKLEEKNKQKNNNR